MKRLLYKLTQLINNTVKKIGLVMNKQLQWEKQLIPFNLRSSSLYMLSSLTLIITTVIQNTVASLLMLVLTLLLIVAAFEYEVYSHPVIMSKRSKKLKEKTIAWIISIKEVFVSFLLVLIFFLLTVLILNFLPFRFEGKIGFHITTFTTFFLSLFSYYFYTKNKISQRLLKKFHRIDESFLQPIEETRLRENSLIVTDLLAILATIFLLSNTTASLVYPADANSLDDVLSTFEFYSLLVVMAIYIPAIYFRIPK